MSKTTDLDPETFIDVMAPAVGLAIPEKYRSETLVYVRLAVAIAQPLIDFDLDETVEPASTFRP
jgi:hypothetical protein